MKRIRMPVSQLALDQQKSRAALACRGLAAGLLTMLALPVALSAQHAVPLDAQHPRAVRAGAVVERLIAGDRPGAEGYLRAHGDSVWVGSARLREELDRLQHLGKGEFRVQAFVKPGPEIIERFGADAVFVMPASPTVNGDGVLVRVGLEAPYHVLGLAPVNANRR